MSQPPFQNQPRATYSGRWDRAPREGNPEQVVNQPANPLENQLFPQRQEPAPNREPMGAWYERVESAAERLLTLRQRRARERQLRDQSVEELLESVQAMMELVREQRQERMDAAERRVADMRARRPPPAGQEDLQPPPPTYEERGPSPPPYEDLEDRRPFVCHCSRRFSRLENLRRHAQIEHDGEGDGGDAPAFNPDSPPPYEE